MPSFSSPIFSAPFSHTQDIVLVHLPMGSNIQTSVEQNKKTKPISLKAKYLLCKRKLLHILQENSIPGEFSPIFTLQLSEKEIKDYEIRCLIPEPQASTLRDLNREFSFRTSHWWPVSPNQHRPTHLSFSSMCLIYIASSRTPQKLIDKCEGSQGMLGIEPKTFF